MSTSNRAARLAKTHKILKKHYKPATLADRPILEHLLYACCLEHAPGEAADEAFARLQQTYYDWNEVRVTTISELSEILSGLPKPADAASRLKRTLQSVFECYYSFDLEPLKKENIGKAVKQLESLDGISKFAVAFVTQNGLGGHAIPVNNDCLECLRVLGVITEEEAKEQRVPGLERAIAKNKGVEFGVLLHQLACEYGSAPFSPRVRAIMLEIAPDAKDRFPKRSRKAAEEESDTDAAPSQAKKATGAKTKQSPPKKDPEKSSSSAAAPKKKTGTKRLSKKKPR